MRQVLPALGEMPANAVTPQLIERCLNHLGQERNWKPATWNRTKALLSLMFRLAVDNQKVEFNPVRLVHKQRENNTRIRWLTEEEEMRLRAVIESDYPDQLPRLT